MLPLAVPARAQQHVRLGSELDDYVRYLELAGKVDQAPLVFRSPSLLAALGPAARDTDHLWAARYPLSSTPAEGGRLRLEPLSPELHAVYNSRYPRTANDGVLWAGRGISAVLSGGARLTWGPVTAVLDPAAYYSQNRAFDQAPESGKGVNRGGLSPYAYAWQNGQIDWPERFGPDAISGLDWGQSGVRVSAGAFTAGFSTENMSWGPALQNPIIMSGTGPGFPHLDLGTARPVWIGIGRAEARVLGGRLAESAWFDTIPDNDGRFFSGIALGIQPRWVNGLTLGVTRAFYQAWDSLGANDYLAIFQTVFKGAFATPADPVGNDLRDQLLSLTARWTFPGAGFEAYVEWARNDHSVNPRDFALQPDHSRAYTLGFQQLLPSGGGQVRLRGEHTTLGRPATIETRATPTYYLHHIVRQGYTHRGQLLGAAIGPGSQSQWLAVDRFDRRGLLGLSFQRVRFDDDAYYTSFSGPNLFRGQQTELSAALSAIRFLGPAEVSTSLAISRELNRHFEVLDDVTNVMLDLRVAWRWR